MTPPRREALHRHLGAFVLLGAPLLLAPAKAGAQDIATAEALFEKGLSEMAAFRYDMACPALAESQRLDPRPGTLFTLATCEDRWGRVATAVTRYGDYLAVVDRLPDEKRQLQAERYQIAKEARDKLLPDVPRLTLSIAGDVLPGTVVKRDGEVVAPVALGIALPIDPGIHAISIQSPNGPVLEQRISIARGEQRTLVLRLDGAAPPPVVTVPVRIEPPDARETPAPRAPSRSYAGPIVAFGATAVGIGVGIGAGFAVLDKRAELDMACPHKDCPASQQGNLEATKALSYVSTGGFVLAGVGAVTGTILLLLPARGDAESPRVAVRPGPGTLTLEGAF